MASETNFIKNVFYKLCFFVGLGTMGAYSFGQITHWVGADSVEVAGHSKDFKSKVNELVHQPNLKGVIERVVEKIVYVPVPAKVEHTVASAVQAAVIPPPVALNPDGTKPGDFPLDANGLPIPGATPFPAVVVASPSPGAPGAAASPADPNATPAPGAAPAVAEAPKVDADGNPIPLTGEVEMAQEQPDPNAYPMQAYAPYAYDPSQMSGAAAPSQSPASDPSAAGNAAGQFGGTVGTGVASNSNPNSNGSSTGGGSTPVAPVTSSTVHTLTSNDMTLINMALKGVFSDSTESVSGSQCQMTNGTASGCTPVNSVAVHTNRWDSTDGLMSNAGFTVKATSNSQVQVTLSLQIQDDNLATQAYSSTVTATQISAHTESRNGKSFRVIELNLPNMTLRNGKDSLTSMDVVLAYDTTTNSVASDSSLTFSRSKVTTVTLPWDSSPNRTPASANETVIDANQITYSMEIEKS